MIKLVFISDTHTQHRQLKMPKGDILIHCGDWTYNGGFSELARLNDWFGELKETHGYKHIITIPGNHDLTAEHSPTLVRGILNQCEILINQPIEVEGLKMWGSPVTPHFCDWAFMLHSDERERIWDGIKKGLDILITHGPPYGVLDCPYGKSEHVGCKKLLEAVKRAEPRIHAFGHIHGSPGMAEIEEAPNTLFINATMVDEKYRVVHQPYEVEYTIEEEKE